MPKEETVEEVFELEENRERFQFDIQSFVVGKTIIGVGVDTIGFVLQLSEGRSINIRIRNKELEISIGVPVSEADRIPGSVM